MPGTISCYVVKVVSISYRDVLVRDFTGAATKCDCSELGTATKCWMRKSFSSVAICEIVTQLNHEYLRNLRQCFAPRSRRANCQMTCCPILQPLGAIGIVTGIIEIRLAFNYSFWGAAPPVCQTNNNNKPISRNHLEPASLVNHHRILLQLRVMKRNVNTLMSLT